MFEIVKCLREKSSPTASMSVETTKPEEVKKYIYKKHKQINEW